ncbi:MAG: hypothetical protein ACRCUY_00825 [Thermoguttaceae bacterium]
MSSVLRLIYETLSDYYEAKPLKEWWPADPIEVICGAVLVTGTTWKSVRSVLETLKKEALLDFEKLVFCDDDKLIEIVRPAGFQTKKAKRLKDIAALFLLYEEQKGDKNGRGIDAFFAREPETIRRDLLKISGIGPGTADNIMLYAGRVPIYMVDQFTQRILLRHRLIGPETKESEIQNLIYRELPPDEEPHGAQLFSELQRLFVQVGRDFCDKSRPRCDLCPLGKMLAGEKPAFVTETVPHPPKPQQVRNNLTGSSFLVTATTSVSPSNNHSGVSSFSAFSTQNQELRPPQEMNLNEIEMKIVAAIFDTPISIDTVIHETGIPAHLVRAHIAILEMKKILRQVEGNQVRRIQ